MTAQVNWEASGFTHNPFNIVPDRISGDKLFWAGFPKIKEKFADIISNSLANENSNLSLIISRYGGGKTHASYYFSQNRNLKEDQVVPHQIMLKTPQQGKSGVQELYIAIIEALKWKNICNELRTFKETNDENSFNLLESFTKSEDIARIIYLLASDDEEIVFEAQSALLGKGTNTSMKKLKIRRLITTNTDRAEVIALLIRVLSLNTPEDQSKRIIIWLDELESLIYYTSKEYRPFTQFLRELFDTSPKYLSLMLSFSFSDPTDTQNIEIVLGKALLDRVKYQIIFDEADLIESMEYLKELFSFYRIEEFDKGPYFPFEKVQLEQIIMKATEESNSPMTPRTLNKWVLKSLEISAKIGIDNLNKPTFLNELDFTEEI